MGFITYTGENRDLEWERRMMDMSIEKLLLDHINDMTYAKETSRAEGRAEERRRLIALLEQGLSVEEIKQKL